jgi:RNA polymerase sigma-70 factor (ECF subfamily)
LDSIYQEEVKETDFNIFFEQNYKLLSNYINSYVNSMSLAEDIVQEVFIKLWEKNAGELDIAYVMKSCKNKMIEIIRKEVALKNREKNYAEGLLDDDSDENTLKYVKIHRLNTLIRQLPPKTQEVFILNKYKGLTYSQIAEMKNLSEKTIENQMGNAFKYLRSNW